MVDTYDLLTQWASEGNEVVDSYLDLTSQFLLEKPSIDPRTQWILRYLTVSCNQTTNSTFLLIANAQLWDAEILLRSVIEGTIKYIYLCLGDENDYISKSEEYLLHLPNIGEIKHQQRIRSFLQNVDNPTSDEYAILRETLIEEAELAELYNNYPRENRKQLEQRWAFNEIANILTRDDIGLKNFDALRYLLSYTYGIGSHLAHQDATGLKLIHNRLQKTFEDARSDELAHASR
ncbi:hypothetical protein IQ272_21760 [Chroococcidiopsidales cyanobacterium LEGE 13417]|nr:hypothetical protein [Chroococcidiopsidales cyanobacterium LEGE 13417]